MAQRGASAGRHNGPVPEKARIASVDEFEANDDRNVNSGAIWRRVKMATFGRRYFYTVQVV